MLPPQKNPKGTSKKIRVMIGKVRCRCFRLSESTKWIFSLSFFFPDALSYKSWANAEMKMRNSRQKRLKRSIGVSVSAFGDFTFTAWIIQHKTVLPALEGARLKSRCLSVSVHSVTFVHWALNCSFLGLGDSSKTEFQLSQIYTWWHQGRPPGGGDRVKEENVPGRRNGQYRGSEMAWSLLVFEEEDRGECYLKDIIMWLWDFPIFPFGSGDPTL